MLYAFHPIYPKIITFSELDDKSHKYLFERFLEGDNIYKGIFVCFYYI
jgi:hypothetical protein